MKECIKQLTGKFYVDKATSPTEYSSRIPFGYQLEKKMKTEMVSPLGGANLLHKRAIIKFFIDQLKNIF